MGVVYALVACITFLLFCIHPLFGYYRNKNNFEKLQESARTQKASSEKKIQELTIAIASSEKRIQELTNDIDTFKRDAKKREDAILKKYLDANDQIENMKRFRKKDKEEYEKQIKDLTSEYDELALNYRNSVIKNTDQEKTIETLNKTIETQEKTIETQKKTIETLEEEPISLKRERVWGTLFHSYGRVQKTLTPEQQALVHYPQLNREKVYFTPDGRAYHSVGWCYTLDKSAVVDSCTLEEARAHQLEPCSKCVHPGSR